MTAEGKIDVSTTDGITTITFYHPQSNSLPGTLLTGLAQSISKAGKDNNTNVIILKSEGEKTFCAGASFNELITIKSMEEGRRFFSGFANVINAMRKCPKFVIARVQGKAVGGGVGVAASADYAIAHSSASVKLSELAVGIGPFVVGPAVERKTGTAAFTAMSINATAWWSAQWALEKNLFTEVHDSLNDVDNNVNTLAHKLASSNPEAMCNLKEVFWTGTENWDTLLAARAEISGKLVLSDFTRNAIQKFKAGVR
jgi:enoyl-CoA hydratase/carnithine racemase